MVFSWFFCVSLLCVKSSQQVRKKAEHAAKLLGLPYAHPGNREKIRAKVKTFWPTIHPDKPGGETACFQLIAIAEEALMNNLINRKKDY